MITMQWKEEYLQYIWKYRLFDTKNLKTTFGERIEILKTGVHNTGQGPDFLFASVQIGNEIHHGHIEIHLDNRDWYAHAHQRDTNYQNVVLHVVLQNTHELYTLGAGHTAMPILCLENYILPSTQENLHILLKTKLDPACREVFKMPSRIAVEQFKSRLMVERILRKSEFIQNIVRKNLFHYENAFYQAILYGFGIKENSEHFLALAESIPWTLTAKYAHQTTKLEALFFGQANMIEPIDEYGHCLQREYDYLKKLHHLEPLNRYVKRTKMLPASFPAIRLAQFVNFITQQQGLYAKLSQFKNLNDIYPYFETATSNYWRTHYDFGKPEMQEKNRKISKAFVDKLIINIILPFRFLREVQENRSTDGTLHLYLQLQAEQNIITKTMERYFNVQNKTAFDSQVLIEWYSEYCQRKRCLDCPIGYETLRK